MPLGHLTVVEADVDASIGVVSEIYPDNSDPILRKRIMIEDADVISRGIIVLGSMLVTDGHHLFVHQRGKLRRYLPNHGQRLYWHQCVRYEDLFRTRSQAIQLSHHGSDSRHCILRASCCSENEKSVGPFAFAGYPSSPVSSKPMDVPTALSWASISSISEDELRIDYVPPSSSEKTVWR